MFDNIDLDRRDREPDGDAKLRQLFEEWTQAVAPPGGWPEADDASEAQSNLVDQLEDAIQATPPSGPVGFALKILVMARSESELGFHDRDGDGVLKVQVVGNNYTDSGYFRATWCKSVFSDAVRFVPELAPMVEDVLAAPYRLPGYGDEDDEPDPLGIGMRIVAGRAEAGELPPRKTAGGPGKGGERPSEPAFKIDAEVWGDGAIVDRFNRWVEAEREWRSFLKQYGEGADVTPEARTLEQRSEELLGELADEPAQGLVGFSIKAFALACWYGESMSGLAASLMDGLILDIRSGVPGMRRLISPEGGIRVWEVAPIAVRSPRNPGLVEEDALDPAEVERRLAQYPPIPLDIDPGEDAEIVGLFQEYIDAEQVHAQLLTLEQEGTEEEEATQDRVTAAVEALARAPARSMVGAALKIFGMLLYSNEAVGASLYPVKVPPNWPDELSEMDQLNAGFVRDLRRLVPGLSPLIAPPPRADAA